MQCAAKNATMLCEREEDVEEAKRFGEGKWIVAKLWLRKEGMDSAPTGEGAGSVRSRGRRNDVTGQARLCHMQWLTRSEI